MNRVSSRIRGFACLSVGVLLCAINSGVPVAFAQHSTSSAASPKIEVIADVSSIRAAPPVSAKRSRLLLVHYMPWFEAKPTHPGWGWHWTMNHADPEHAVAGRRDAASQFYPLIGLYDSSDPDTLECQVMLMKLAGIDGVIVDWYGNDAYLDYGGVNRNLLKLIPIVERAGLQFAVCYEDQTVPKEIAAGKFTAGDAVTHGQHLFQWMQQNVFSSPAYVRISDRPVLLSFGNPYYTDAQWNAIFSVLPAPPEFVTENDRRAPTASIGGFDWPAPGGGAGRVAAEQQAFQDRAGHWPFSISAAYPRFADFYRQAGIGNSYGQIDDRGGKTFEETLTCSLQGAAPIVQIVTWNDWGEGTQIEPSMEFGYRDLETTQRLRKSYLPANSDANAADLRLPVAWYLLMKKYSNDSGTRAKLAEFFPLVIAGHLDQARALLARYK